MEDIVAVLLITIPNLDMVAKDLFGGTVFLGEQVFMHGFPRVTRPEQPIRLSSNEDGATEDIVN